MRQLVAQLGGPGAPPASTHLDCEVPLFSRSSRLCRHLELLTRHSYSVCPPRPPPAPHTHTHPFLLPSPAVHLCPLFLEGPVRLDGNE